MESPDETPSVEFRGYKSIWRGRKKRKEEKRGKISRKWEAAMNVVLSLERQLQEDSGVLIEEEDSYSSLVEEECGVEEREILLGLIESHQEMDH